MKRALGAAVLLLLLAGPAAADPSDIGAPTSIESFFDGAIGTQIADGQAVGATVALVQDGHVVFARGYGFADAAQRTPVSADRTLFRIGSVSKAFVWVAVMQQVAAGKLDLNEDVNTYLIDFQIPATFPVPITLRHLMSHTAGFEDRIAGLFAHGARTVGDYEANLIRMLPARVMMPGHQAAYSNYGAALAAHLVERVSGEAWDDYVEGHVLEPLGMQRSTTRQPPPEPLDKAVATGYRFDDGAFEAEGFEFITLPPAGSMSAPATDMARFMVELLRRDDSPVLSASSRARLYESAFAPDERINGMLHGFYEQSSHGQRMIGHAGDTLLFHSILRLYPEQNMGLFVSFNSDRGALARDRVLLAFEDRLFGVPEPPAPGGDAVPGRTRYTGAWRSLRVPANGPTRLLSLLSSFRVRADDQGRLVLPDGQGGVRSYVEIDRDLFASVDGRSRVAFIGGDPDGPATHLYFDTLPMMGFERAPAHDDPALQQALVAGCLVVLVLVVVWPLSTLSHRSRPGVQGETAATLVGFLTAAALVACAVGLAVVVTDANDVVFGLPPLFERLLWIPVLVAPLLLVMASMTVQAWVRGYWWLRRRIHYTLVWFAAAAFEGWLVYWHLVALPARL